MDEIFNYMASPVFSIDAQATVEEGAQYICEKKVSSLLVKENEEYVGIVTQTDLVKRIMAKGLDPKTVRMHSVMSKPIMKMDHYLTRKNAHEFMVGKNIKHLAVTKKGEIIGVLTVKDMLSEIDDEYSSIL
jgi:signal-transduction protein with cAMP-binding, CBS, and nucleotidyltransferase domain